MSVWGQYLKKSITYFEENWNLNASCNMSFSWANIALNGAEEKIKNSIATQQPHHFLSSWFHSFKTTIWWNWSKKVKGVTKGLKTVAMTLLFLVTDSIAWWGLFSDQTDTKVFGNHNIDDTLWGELHIWESEIYY